MNTDFHSEIIANMNLPYNLDNNFIIASKKHITETSTVGDTLCSVLLVDPYTLLPLYSNNKNLYETNNISIKKRYDIFDKSVIKNLRINISSNYLYRAVFYNNLNGINIVAETNLDLIKNLHLNHYNGLEPATIRLLRDYGFDSKN